MVLALDREHLPYITEGPETWAPKQIEQKALEGEAVLDRVLKLSLSWCFQVEAILHLISALGQ